MLCCHLIGVWKVRLLPPRPLWQQFSSQLASLVASISSSAAQLLSYFICGVLSLLQTTWLSPRRTVVTGAETLDITTLPWLRMRGHYIYYMCSFELEKKTTSVTWNEVKLRSTAMHHEWTRITTVRCPSQVCTVSVSVRAYFWISLHQTLCLVERAVNLSLLFTRSLGAKECVPFCIQLETVSMRLPRAELDNNDSAQKIWNVSRKKNCLSYCLQTLVKNYMIRYLVV